ncbi:metalloproteinase inhibitor 1 [Latimeria chalumnae]|uniref:metalloproteinase inhibitor 1 n=1 Tax=Latimeria chalumnae TaxID=7897 RepID=UPI0006D8D999|nr:PREDICTED: metalloproteinase inhibitor 1-like [Latimeria chalumnae]|eukprot:XP_006004040.2 PREDICTED: metalloproteinase inhibitor 1-like [Latimeria chalumnae]
MISNACGILGAVVLLLVAQQPSDACSCAPQHPQMAFCYSDVVIRGKIISSKTVKLDGSVGGQGDWIQYEVKQTKMLKGFEKVQDVQFLYSPLMPSLCGFELKPASKQEEYVIAGHLIDGDRLMVTACSFLHPWSSLTSAQKTGLLHTYKRNCNCTVVPCISIPCSVSTDNECLWSDGLVSRNWNHSQAQNFACVHRANGGCGWQSQRLASLRKRARSTTAQ